MTANNLIIRPFKMEDRDSAVELAADLGLSPWTLTDYKEELARPDSKMIAAISGPDLAGFIVGRRVPGPGKETEPDAEIYNIGISKKFQRSGIGSMLLAEFIEDCRRSGVRDVWLDVRSANAAAIRFYKSFGFKEFAKRRNFYRNPTDDGIVMQLRLDSGLC